MMAFSATHSGEREPQRTAPDGRFDRYRWLPFVLPLLVYMFAQALLEPSQPEPLPESEVVDDATLEARKEIRRESGSRRVFGFAILYEHYPIVYTVKIVLTVAVLAWVWPVYTQFAFRVSWLAIAVGAIGIVVWVVLCNAQIESRLLGLVGLGDWLELGERPGYSPLEQLANSPLWAYIFLAVRFAGLVLVVPIIEEMFYRAFLMRLVMAERWWEVPFGDVNSKAVAVGIVVPALAHPGELIAAIVWFGMVTWLMIRTRNIWDCVAAHAVTNLLLGIYVLTSGQWQLW